MRARWSSVSRSAICNAILNAVRTRFADRDAGGRGLQTFDLRTTIHAVTALEAALLDLLGQFLACRSPRCSAKASSATRCEMLGYLFYVGDRRKTDLPTGARGTAADDWFRLRNEEALTPEAVVRLAEAAQARYGFNDFKLKGGVLAGARRDGGGRRAGRALPRRRASRSTPTAPGRSRRRSRCAGASSDVLAYAEDPCGAENGYSGREIMAEFRRATGLADRDQHDRDRLAPDGPRDPAAVGRHPARRSAFLDHAGLGARGADVPRLGPHLGLALEQPFRHFARDVHACGRRGARQDHGDRHALDLAGRPAPDRRPFSIEGGKIAVPRNGVGWELNLIWKLWNERMYFTRH